MKMRIAAWLALGALAGQTMAATVTDLRCEFRTAPLGIDEPKPRLGWVLAADGTGDDERGLRQTAYRVLVASSAEELARNRGDLWDSGRIASDESAQVEYAGAALPPARPCFWKVRAWTEQAKPQGERESAWSRPASWSMGLRPPGSAPDAGGTAWQAQWIGFDEAEARLAAAAADDARYNTAGLKWVQFPAKQAKPAAGATALRKSFELPAGRKVARAVLALYAFNECAASLNGAALGAAAHWDRTARLDAAAALRPGPNVLALSATHSDAHPPAAIGKLVVRFESGADLVVPLDATWKAAQAPAPGWEKPGFDDAAWAAAEAIDKTPWRGAPAVNDVPRVPAPYLRKEFAVTGAVRRATLYATALGAYEMRLNGQRVGADELTPGWTEFRKRVHYQSYDVTAQVRRGPNALGAVLGDGWYASVLAHLSRRHIYGGRPRLLAQLVIECADGTTQVVASDGTWKAAYGPILHADLLLGCELDQRRAMPGWDTPGFDARAWAAVAADDGRLQPDGVKPAVQAAVADPSRRFEELPALKVTEPRPGCYIFDLGQNMVGWARLRVRGDAGQRLTVRHGEMLNPDGTLYTANLRSCPAADFYTLAGGGREILEPAFTFHGFRYVEVRGLGARPGKDAVTGIVVHSDLRRTGEFECSSALLNQLYHNIVWGQKGNHLEIPTDCPQRDERMGWTGDTQFFAPTGAYNYDVAAFFERWLTTICEDSQQPNGSFAHVVPDIMNGGAATAWGDAALLCTYNVYRVYGDTRVVAAHFAAMERYMAFVAAKSKDFVPNIGGFGDWLNLGGGASREVIDTAYYAHLAGIMTEMARAIGRGDDADRYDRLHESVKAAFAKFFQPDGSLKDSSQTGYALAFTMDLVPEAIRAVAAERFVEQIKKFDWHLATGFIGTPRLMPALTAAGRDDVAFRLLLQESYPSWLFQVKNGATTMWERWNGWTPEQGFGDIGMNSFNHYAFGAVGEYLYGSVGGIRAGAPGYRTIRIRPVAGEGLAWAKTRFVSVRGPIATAWKKEGGRLALDVTIPANAAATVWVPAPDALSVTESGRPAGRAPGVKFLRAEPGAAVYAVGAGTYKFEAPAP